MAAIASVVDVVLRNVPRIILVAFYLYVSGLLLIISFHGSKSIFDLGLIYDPVKLGMLQYKILVHWWWPKKVHLGIMPVIKIVSVYLGTYIVFSKAPMLFNRFLDGALDTIFSPLKTILRRKSKKSNYNSQISSSRNYSTHRQGSIVQSSINTNKKQYTPEEIAAMKERIMKKVERQLDNKLGDMKNDSN